MTGVLVDAHDVLLVGEARRLAITTFGTKASLGWKSSQWDFAVVSLRLKASMMGGHGRTRCLTSDKNHGNQGGRTVLDADRRVDAPPYL